MNDYSFYKWLSRIKVPKRKINEIGKVCCDKCGACRKTLRKIGNKYYCQDCLRKEVKQ